VVYSTRIWLQYRRASLALVSELSSPTPSGTFSPMLGIELESSYQLSARILYPTIGSVLKLESITLSLIGIFGINRNKLQRRGL